MPETFFELSECLTNPKPTYILEDRIQSFVYSLCYKKYEGKESFSYKSLCDIAMFVAQNDKPKEEVKEHISHKPKQEEIKRPLGEVEQFEKEWLEHRAAMRNEAKLEDDDGQIRLY